MRVSLALTNHALDPDPQRCAARLSAVGQAADDAGIDTVWVPDHLVQADPTAGEDRDLLECLTVLGFLARATRRVRLGALVSAVTFRPPALLIKAVTSLDVLSGGRAWLGLGAGYLDAEATAFGLPLPETSVRFEYLEDALELAHRMWSGDTSPFHGRRVDAERATLDPAPIAVPHPPVLVGGTGERRTLRLVARHADAANVFDLPDGGATVRHKLEVLDERCREVGRDPAEVERTLSTRRGPGQTHAEVIAHCREMGRLGIDHVILHQGPPWTPEAVHETAHLVDALAA